MGDPGTRGQLAWVVICCVVALAGTWLARRYALRRRLLDEPGARRSHTTSTPRGGGISIVVSMLLAMTWLAWHRGESAHWLYPIGVGLCLVSGAGWADDHRPLSPWFRLAVHALAAMLLGWAVADAGGGVATAIAAGIGAMVLVNVWNFMDGIDGLATSQALLVALGYALLVTPGVVGWLALALVGACLGFLPFNVPKARVFLGDVGSGALGYLLAALLAWTYLQHPDPFRAPMLLLPLTAFLVDASLTLLTRIVDGQRWWTPHTRHAYQQWARRLRAHLPVTLAYAGWTTAMVVLMLAGRALGPAFSMLMLVMAALGGAWAWRRLQEIEPGTGRGATG